MQVLIIIIYIYIIHKNMRNATAHGTSSVAWGKWSHPKWGKASCYHPARCSLTSQDSIGQNYVHVLPDPFTSAQGVFRDLAQSKVHPQVHRKSPDQLRIFRSTRNEVNTELPTQWLSGTPDFPLATAVRTSKHLFRKFATPEACKNHRWVDRVRWCEVLIDRSTSTSLLSWNGLTDRLNPSGDMVHKPILLVLSLPRTRWQGRQTIHASLHQKRHKAVPDM